MTLWDETQQVTNFDLVILDGDGLGAQEIREDASIHSAVRAGVWVLGFDVAEDDKTDGLGYSLNAATPGTSPAYLVRQTRRTDGHQLNTFIDFVNHPGTADEQAKQIVAYLTTSELEAQQYEPAVPARALTIEYRSIDPAAQVSMPANNNPVFDRKATQVATWRANHYVSIFLDAKTSPQGDFQHLVVETDGLANPNELTIDNIDVESGAEGQGEIAYIQTLFQANHGVTPGSTSNNTLTLLESSPTNTNNTTNITTGFSFGINFSADSGASGSFSYNYSKTENITDWGLENDTNSSEAIWSFYSQNPYKGQTTSGFDDSAWFYYADGVAPTTPNGLSLYDNEYSTLAHWTNDAVSSDWITVSGTDTATYTDAWVVLQNNDDNFSGNAPHCPNLCGCSEYGCPLVQHMYRYAVDKPWSLRVNMGAVIPVNVKSLTFSPNPVVANQVTQATLTLESPTPVDAAIILSSDKPGIAPPNEVYTIKAGQDSISFPVNTGAQGCQEESATITAFYANPVNAILDINPPPNCS